MDVLEGHFGTAAGGELVDAVARAPIPQLAELHRRLGRFAEAALVPPKPAGQLRPYVPLLRDNFARAAHDFYLRPADFDDPGNAELIWREVCQEGVVDFSHFALVVGVVVGWVGGGPAGCARRAVRLIYAGLGPQDHGSSWGAAV